MNECVYLKDLTLPNLIRLTVKREGVQIEFIRPIPKNAQESVLYLYGPYGGGVECPNED